MTPPEVEGCPEVFSISSPRLCQPGLSHSTETVATQNGGILLFAQKRGAKSTSLEVSMVLLSQSTSDVPKPFLPSLPPAVLRLSLLPIPSKRGLSNHPRSLSEASISRWANATPPSPAIQVRKETGGPSENHSQM